MSRRLHYWQIILLCLNLACSPPFFRKDHLRAGIKNYQNRKYSEAIKDLNRAIKEYPYSLIPYQYLYLCYRAIGDESMAIASLLHQIRLKSTDTLVYRISYDYFRKRGDYHRCFEILSAASTTIPKRLDNLIPVTRENLAFLFAGASNKFTGKDYIRFTEQTGIMSRFPDGNFYPQDRVTMGNFIIMISKLLPEKKDLEFSLRSDLQKIDTRSFYYLPTLRLINYRIIEPGELLRPEEYLPLTLAIKSIQRLRKIINF